MYRQLAASLYRQPTGQAAPATSSLRLRGTIRLQIHAFHRLVPRTFHRHALRRDGQLAVVRPQQGDGLGKYGGDSAGRVATAHAMAAAARLVGSGFLLSQLVSQKLVGDADDDPIRRRRNFGVLAIGYSVSGMLGPSAAGFLYDLIGAAGTFLVLALMPLIVLAVLLRRRGALPGPTALIPVRRRFFELLTMPGLRRLYLSVALTSSAWDVHQFVVPIYGRSIGLSASDIGLILGAFGTATLIIRVVMPLMLARLSEWAAIWTAQVVALAVFVAYPFFDEFHALTALSFVLGLGLGLGQPMALSLLHSLTPPGRVGEAVGLRLMIINGTQTILPSGFGALGGLLGVASLFWTVGAVIAVGLIAQAGSGYNRER